MQNNTYYKNCLSILKQAIKKQISVSEACAQAGREDGYVSTYCIRINTRLAKNQVTKEEAKEIIDLYDKAKQISKSRTRSVVSLKTKSKSKDISKNVEINLNEDEKSQIEYDAFNDDKYDERSSSSIIRDQDKKITSYSYKILIRDENPLEGYFTKEEMDLVYRLYSNMDGAGLTLRAVSRHFKNLTFRDFKRILRAFNITKSSIPIAPHIIEESTEEEVLDMIFRNKENNILKKLEDERGKYVEKNLRDAHKLLINYRSNEEFIESIITKYFSRENKEKVIEKNKVKEKSLKGSSSKKTGTATICMMSDLHVGKFYDAAIFGRGYDKHIAQERMIQIANHVIEDHKKRNSSEIVLIFGGDVVEGVPHGLRTDSSFEMDLFAEDQIFAAVDMLKEMILLIDKSVDCKIQFHAVGGNHDRCASTMINSQRDDDKGRTIAKIVYNIVKREVENENIIFNIPKNNLIRLIVGNLFIFLQHGDASLAKKKPADLINLFAPKGNFYSLLLMGHWHSIKVEEGTNYTACVLPSICSTDKYIMEELGNNCLPAILIANESDYENCSGLDYRKITLY